MAAERKMETTRLSCTVGHVIDMVEGKVLVSRGGYGVREYHDAQNTRTYRATSGIRLARYRGLDRVEGVRGGQRTNIHRQKQGEEVRDP